MEGEKLGAVNNAIRDVMTIMPEIQEDTSDATIKISALKFSDKAEWIYNEPKLVEDFKWSDISEDGGTNLSAAYDELGKWLSKKENDKCGKGCKPARCKPATTKKTSFELLLSWRLT